MSTLMLWQLYCLSAIPSGINLPPNRARLACSSVELVKKEAKKNNLPPSLLAALIYVESGWKRKAVSHAGACGLTQVLPKYTGGHITDRKYSCRELKVARTSIIVGAKILGFWIHKYGRGNLKVGLCGYSSGYRCKGRSPIKRGMGYARKVLRYKKRIEKQQE